MAKKIRYAKVFNTRSAGIRAAQAWYRTFQTRFPFSPDATLCMAHHLEGWVVRLTPPTATGFAYYLSIRRPDETSGALDAQYGLVFETLNSLQVLRRKGHAQPATPTQETSTLHPCTESTPPNSCASIALHALTGKEVRYWLDRVADWNRTEAGLRRTTGKGLYRALSFVKQFGQPIELSDLVPQCGPYSMGCTLSQLFKHLKTRPGKYYIGVTRHGISAEVTKNGTIFVCESGNQTPREWGRHHKSTCKPRHNVRTVVQFA